ncbi:hypothetical protein TVAG_046850 [Trichomonas vaginalis G3]|uniref:Uncharacterized protein n=1 Tax=Trichomonas vaginalis (strain ATCC PRA-98 / G3) TaxID=412133 RepID=A2EAR0_TRIV3|nr:regulation of centriole replication [Trichomonas vaginalis G3]EAY10263.1 hypothetical protein TVAG_046850 [Trichomonas vaginalis G3]KAI5487747.1 regulation of centriole replication [Trichomonas vaginalis G3]|eukprot:XP_001322486.1 hypothetical protein [Trichomonas vaginalis G3]
MDLKQISPQDKLKIKQFFQQHDAHEYVKSFMADTFGDGSQKPRRSNLSASKVSVESQSNDIQVTEPSLLVELKDGAAFDEFHKSAIKTTIQITIDLLGKLYVIGNIKACQCPNIGHKILIPLKSQIETLITDPRPMRICISTTSPDLSFVGLNTYNWRKVFSEGKTSASIEIIGLQNEIVGVLHFNFSLLGYPEGMNYSKYKQLLDLQIRQETLDKIEAERQYAVKLKIWWRELQQLIEVKSFNIVANELGDNASKIFDFITPFYERSLLTPGHCLRFAYLMSPIIAPATPSFLPIWAVISSRCGGEREKLNLLVSLLRGFGFNAYVAVGQPKCFAVAFSTALIFFDVMTGKFGDKPPVKCQTVSYLYNESSLYANLNPKDNISQLQWDVKNPLRWKYLEAPPKSGDKFAPSISDDVGEPIKEEEIELKVKKIIEIHRNSIGLLTKWNTELPQVLLPKVDSYEREKVTGQSLAVDSLAKDAISMKMKPYHSLRAAPALTNSTSPEAIFSAIVKSKCGAELLSARDNEASFVVIIRCTKYPNGLVATWALLAIDSVSPPMVAKK